MILTNKPHKDFKHLLLWCVLWMISSQMLCPTNKNPTYKKKLFPLSQLTTLFMVALTRSFILLWSFSYLSSNTCFLSCPLARCYCTTPYPPTSRRKVVIWSIQPTTTSLTKSHIIASFLQTSTFVLRIHPTHPNIM